MQLHHQISGSGEPLIILHGLFGTLENWGTQTKALSEQFQVIAIDLRNHGKSPHANHMDYPAMTGDIIELLDSLNLPAVHLLGHSMGGKVAMQLALTHPQRVKKLIVADIAPVHYPPHHDTVFKGLEAVRLADINSRKEADQQLGSHVKEPAVRAFLLKNLYRGDDKQFHWRMNLPVLKSQYAHISQPPHGIPFTGPTLFIKGETSDYILPQYRTAVLTLFPNAQYKMLAGAGHWPHAEKPAAFGKLVINFLQSA